MKKNDRLWGKLLSVFYFCVIILLWCLPSCSQTESVNILRRFPNLWREIIETKPDVLESGNTLRVSRQIQRKIPSNDILANETQGCTISSQNNRKSVELLWIAIEWEVHVNILPSLQSVSDHSTGYWNYARLKSCPISFSVIKPVASNPLF